MGGTNGSGWTPWRVVPGSGFEVADASGNVGIVQVDHKRFVVEHEFRFSDPEIEGYLVRKVVANGASEEEARRMVDEARTYRPAPDKTTDLASIPQFMRWFENPYGKHSLAALIHDELIVDTANGGALASDTLSDRFFREMMRTSGVPYLKRWIMWAAVAVRSRFAAGGLRRWSLIAWALLWAFGMACVIGAFGDWWLGWSVPGGPGWALVVAAVLPFAGARLWGEQWGASLVFAVAAFWVIPAGMIAGAGFLVYAVLERIARRIGYV